MTSRLIVNGELVLYGDVGDFWGDGSGFSSQEVLVALAELGAGDITVRINSGGGFVYEGYAIYNAIKAHPGQKTVYVDGIAASAASLIAMAGDLLVMRSASIMMIHDPSGFTWGTADDHRNSAKVLDSLASICADIYAARSGKSVDEVRQLMKDETWLEPAQAVAEGFADELENKGEEEATAYSSFDYMLYRNTPASLRAAHRPSPVKKPAATAASREEVTTMPDVKNPVDAAPTPAPAPAPAPVAAEPAPAPAPAPAAPAPAPAPAFNPTEVYQRADAAGLTLAEANDIVAKCGSDASKAKDLIIDAVAAKKNPEPFVPAGVTQDARDKFRQGATKGLLFRAGMKDGERNEFSSLTLRELAREALAVTGRDKRAWRDPMEMIKQAFAPVMEAGLHSTSDFTEVLANVANKSLLKGWEEAEETFTLWTSRGVLVDFKPTKRVDLNLFPNLEEVPEGGEYIYGTIGERGETIQLATYGKKFAITRQAIVNDDMSVFTRIPSRMGKAAKRTVGNLAYAVLTGNPAMSDGENLFSSAHANLNVGGVAIPDVAALDAARAGMATQQDPDGIAAGGLNISPKFFLVPVALKGKATILMNAEFDPAATQRVPNSVAGMAQVVADARLDAASTTAWYLAGDPNQYDTIEVAYLNGNDQPVLEQRDGWDVDGVEYKVRLDAGVKALDFHALSKNEGDETP